MNKIDEKWESCKTENYKHKQNTPASLTFNSVAAFPQSATSLGNILPKLQTSKLNNASHTWLVSSVTHFLTVNFLSNLHNTGKRKRKRKKKHNQVFFFFLMRLQKIRQLTTTPISQLFVQKLHSNIVLTDHDHSTYRMRSE